MPYSEASILSTLLVPGLVRTLITQNQTVECYAYLTKKVHLNGGRIDLQLNVVELLSKKKSAYSDTQLKTFEILEKKAQVGRKDVDTFIKSKIIKGE